MASNDDLQAFRNIEREERIQLAEKRLDVWMQAATRFFVLANAGAAVAVLSFLGTQRELGLFGIFATVALLSFAAGIGAAGLAIMGQTVGAWKAFLFATAPDATGVEASVGKHCTTKLYDRAEERTATILTWAFGLYLFGMLVGVAGLIVAAGYKAN